MICEVLLIPGAFLSGDDSGEGVTLCALSVGFSVIASKIFCFSHSSKVLSTKQVFPILLFSSNVDSDSSGCFSICFIVSHEGGLSMLCMLGKLSLIGSSSLCGGENSSTDWFTTVGVNTCKSMAGAFVLSESGFTAAVSLGKTCFSFDRFSTATVSQAGAGSGSSWAIFSTAGVSVNICPPGFNS